VTTGKKIQRKKPRNKWILHGFYYLLHSICCVLYCQSYRVFYYLWYTYVAEI